MRRKIISSLFALFLFFTIGAATAVLYMTNTTSELNHIIELHQVEQLRRALVINLQTVQSNLYTINTPFANELNSIVENVMTLEETAARCSSCHHRRELSDRIIKMQSLIRDYETYLSYFITLRANSKRLQKFKKEAVAMGDRLLAMTEQMSHSATTSLADQTSKAMLEINHVKIILLVTVIITFLLGIMVAVRLTNSVTHPIKVLLNATRMIASGKYGATITYKDKTEFGELAEHFNSMSTAIKDGYEKIRKEIAERKQTEEALRHSEEKLQSVFNQMQDVFFRTDKEGLVTWVSPSAATLMNYNSTDECIGQNITDIFTNPEKKQHFMEELSSKGKVANFETELRRKDGTLIIVSINAHYYLNKDGEIEGIQGVCRDITERKKLEEERMKFEKLESIGILAGGIAHDFNNILTTIVTNLKLAKMASHSGKDVSEILADAEEACRRAKDMTNRLLTFSKGGSPIKKITSIREQLEDSSRFALKGSKVRCEFSIPEDLWLAEIDEGQINQVIYNLVINANQSMPDGGTIRISAENIRADTLGSLPLARRDYIKITVKDEGIGIPKEHLKKIFDPYYTTKQKGSGLGLASTYSIISNHDGYIDVESEIGTGTTFHFYLPAVKGQAPPKNKKRQRIFEGEGKILLMDDDENILTTVSKTLSKIGYTVVPARDGAEAIALYMQALESADPFDAVIMDLTVRDGMGGKEAVQRLLKIDPDARVIVSSGYSTDTIMANYERHGFRGVITKPYQIETLSELLHQVISQV